jgi:hypothetical protein
MGFMQQRLHVQGDKEVAHVIFIDTAKNQERRWLRFYLTLIQSCIPWILICFD